MLCRSKKADKIGPAKLTKQQDILVHIEKSVGRECDLAGECPETARACPDASIPGNDQPVVAKITLDLASSASPTGHGGQVVAQGLLTVDTAVQSTGEQSDGSRGNASVSPEKPQQPPQTGKAGLKGRMSGPHGRKRKHGALAAALARSQDGGNEAHDKNGQAPKGDSGCGLFFRSPGKPPKRLQSHLSVSSKSSLQSDRVVDKPADSQEPVDERSFSKKISNDVREDKEEVDEPKTAALKASGAIPQVTTANGVVPDINLLHSSPYTRPEDAEHDMRRRLDEVNLHGGGVSLHTSPFLIQEDCPDDVHNVTGPMRQSEAQSHDNVINSSAPERIDSKLQSPMSGVGPHNGMMPAVQPDNDGGHNRNAPHFTFHAVPTPGSQHKSQDIGDGAAVAFGNTDGTVLRPQLKV